MCVLLALGVLVLHDILVVLSIFYTYAKDISENIYISSKHFHEVAHFPHRKVKLTLRDKVRVEDELIRHHEASGHKQLVISVVLDIVQSVDSSEAH